MSFHQKRSGQSQEIVHTRLICHYEAINNQLFTSQSNSRVLNESKDSIFPQVTLSKTTSQESQTTNDGDTAKYFKLVSKKAPLNLKKMLAQYRRQRLCKLDTIRTQYNPSIERLHDNHSAPCRGIKKDLTPCPQIWRQGRNNNQKNKKQNISTSVIVVCIQQPKKPFLKARTSKGTAMNFNSYPKQHHLTKTQTHSFVAVKQKKDSFQKIQSICAWSTFDSDEE